ncbi:MAG: hypothetical protein WC052_05700 [Patescibacteria group bacterium]
MKTKYSPYLLSRIAVRWAGNISGINEVCYYDYMGAAEYEFGKVPTSIMHMRAFCKDNAMVIHELDVAPRKGWVQGGDKLYALVMPSYVESLEKGAQSLADGIARVMNNGGCKMPPMLEYDFSGWHDIENDIFFTPNETFAQLIYSVLSRDVEYTKMVDKELRIGDRVGIATVINGKTVTSVKNMGIQEGKVAAILEDTLTVKSSKNYRMPFAFILNRCAEVIKNEKA